MEEDGGKVLAQSKNKKEQKSEVINAGTSRLTHVRCQPSG